MFFKLVQHCGANHRASRRGCRGKGANRPSGASSQRVAFFMYEENDGTGTTKGDLGVESDSAVSGQSEGPKVAVEQSRAESLVYWTREAVVLLFLGSLLWFRVLIGW